MTPPPSTQNILTFSGYKHRLHNANVAVLTLSTTSSDYLLVDGALQRLVRSYTPVIIERTPQDLARAHEALWAALSPYSVWILLREMTYPAWAIGTLLQVHSVQTATRLFMVAGYPFHLTEFLLT